MQKLIFILFFVNFCFSQENKLTISQIDSICKISNRCAISDGVIEVKDNSGKIIGKGGFSSITWVINNLDFEKYSLEEKKHFDFYKKSKLIKGAYHQRINYNNYNEEYYLSFYYYDSKPFFILIELIKQKDNNEIIKEVIQLDESSINQEKIIQNKFNLDLRELIESCNASILELNNIK